PIAAGAGIDRHRHRLCHHRPLSGPDDGLARVDRHRPRGWQGAAAMSLSWSQQLILVPVILPLLCGAALILGNETRRRLKFAFNLGSVLILLAVALSLMWQVDSGYLTDGVGVYLAANWAAPFGIALVVDRLAALMLLLTAVLAACSLLYALKRW